MKAAERRSQGLSLSLEGLGKKFYHRWVFRAVSLQVQAPARVAIIGGNGTGKSTLMRIIAGQLSPSEGARYLYSHGKLVPQAHYYRHLSWMAPYLDIYPDLTLAEHLRMHFRFRACLLQHPQEVVKALELDAHRDKKLRYFSSGMLQRAKVGMALFTRSDLLLLDEPTSNMDTYHASLIQELLNAHTQDRLLVLASNLPREYKGFEQFVQLGGAQKRRGAGL